MTQRELKRFRMHIRSIDRQILDLILKRAKLVSRAWKVKKELGLSLRDQKQEKKVEHFYQSKLKKLKSKSARPLAKVILSATRPL